MTRVPATKDELWRYLLEQLDFLRTSCAAFDGGRLAEAKRLATTTRVLLHDGRGNTKSLLRQLKFLPGMGFLCTARSLERELLYAQNARLVSIRVEAGIAAYSAPAGRIPPRPGTRHRIVMFPQWWNEPVIRTQSARLTRRDVVLTLSDNLGGAHVDASIDAVAADLIRSRPVGARVTVNDVDQVLGDLDAHTMRQIAYEVLQSIDRRLRHG